MSRLFLVLLVLVALIATFVNASSPLNEASLETEVEKSISPELNAELESEAEGFADSILSEIDQETTLETESENEGAEAQEQVEELEQEADQTQEEEINNFIEMGVGDDGDAPAAPSYTLPYPAITYASHAAGGFFHPFSNVNPLTAPWAGFAPVAGPASYPVNAAALAATPLSYYNAGLGIHPAVYHGGLGVNPTLYATMLNNAKGAYNNHGLGQYGVYHPGFAADLASLGGKAGGTDGKPPGGGDDSFVEVDQGQLNNLHSHSLPLASDHDPANVDADADKVAYGLYPAPTPESTTHFVRSNTLAMLGPHKLNFASVGENELDDVWPAFVETQAETSEIKEDGCVGCVFD